MMSEMNCPCFSYINRHILFAVSFWLIQAQPLIGGRAKASIIASSAHCAARP